MTGQFEAEVVNGDIKVSPKWFKANLKMNLYRLVFNSIPLYAIYNQSLNNSNIEKFISVVCTINENNVIENNTGIKGLISILFYIDAWLSYVSNAFALYILKKNKQCENFIINERARSGETFPEGENKKIKFEDILVVEDSTDFKSDANSIRNKSLPNDVIKFRCALRKLQNGTSDSLQECLKYAKIMLMKNDLMPKIYELTIDWFNKNRNLPASFKSISVFDNVLEIPEYDSLSNFVVLEAIALNDAQVILDTNDFDIWLVRHNLSMILNKYGVVVQYLMDDLPDFAKDFSVYINMLIKNDFIKLPGFGAKSAIRLMEKLQKIPKFNALVKSWQFSMSKIIASYVNTTKEKVIEIVDVQSSSDINDCVYLTVQLSILVAKTLIFDSASAAKLKANYDFSKNSKIFDFYNKVKRMLDESDFLCKDFRDLLPEGKKLVVVMTVLILYTSFVQFDTKQIDDLLWQSADAAALSLENHKQKLTYGVFSLIKSIVYTKSTRNKLNFKIPSKYDLCQIESNDAITSNGKTGSGIYQLVIPDEITLNVDATSGVVSIKTVIDEENQNSVDILRNKLNQEEFKLADWKLTEIARADTLQFKKLRINDDAAVGKDIYKLDNVDITVTELKPEIHQFNKPIAIITKKRKKSSSGLQKKGQGAIGSKRQLKQVQKKRENVKHVNKPHGHRIDDISDINIQISKLNHDILNFNCTDNDSIRSFAKKNEEPDHVTFYRYSMQAINKLNQIVNEEDNLLPHQDGALLTIDGSISNSIFYSDKTALTIHSKLCKVSDVLKEHITLGYAFNNSDGTGALGLDQSVKDDLILKMEQAEQSLSTMKRSSTSLFETKLFHHKRDLILTTLDTILPRFLPSSFRVRYREFISALLVYFLHPGVCMHLLVIPKHWCLIRDRIYTFSQDINPTSKKRTAKSSSSSSKKRKRGEKNSRYELNTQDDGLGAYNAEEALMRQSQKAIDRLDSEIPLEDEPKQVKKIPLEDEPKQVKKIPPHYIKPNAIHLNAKAIDVNQYDYLVSLFPKLALVGKFVRSRIVAELNNLVTSEIVLLEGETQQKKDDIGRYFVNMGSLVKLLLKDNNQFDISQLFNIEDGEDGEAIDVFDNESSTFADHINFNSSSENDDNRNTDIGPIFNTTQREQIGPLVFGEIVLYRKHDENYYLGYVRHIGSKIDTDEDDDEKEDTDEDELASQLTVLPITWSEFLKHGAR